MSDCPASESSMSSSLIAQVSRAALWNSVLVPLLGLFQLVFAVVIRRRFGLGSGVYDVLIGLMATLVLHSSVGIPTALLKFLPEIAHTAGPQALRRLLRDALATRLLLLTILLGLMNLYAETVAAILDLGPLGPTFLRMISAIALARATIDLMVRTLNAFFAQKWSNIIALVQVIFELAFVGIALMLGYQMNGALGGLLSAALVVALLSIVVVSWQLGHVTTTPNVSATTSNRTRLWFSGEAGRFLRFSAFTYVFGLSGYFTQMDFAAPALAIVLSTEDVALFSTAFKLAFMTVGLVVASFRGVYRPLFARVMLKRDIGQLRRTFVAVSKAQLVVLLPGGFGLMVMSGDYIPLLFGTEFLRAVPLAWVLIGFLYAETTFNLPGIVLSTDERYRALVWLRSPTLLTAPLFLGVAVWSGLLPAAVVFGASRLAMALLAYAFTCRLYGFRFPWAFTGRIGLVSLVMAGTLAMARTFWPTSIVEAIVLTVVGLAVFVVGLRATGAIGPEELDLLRRTDLPGHTKLVGWFDSTRGNVK